MGHPSGNEHVGCWPLRPWGYAALNTRVQALVWTCGFLSQGSKPRSGTAGSGGDPIRVTIGEAARPLHALTLHSLTRAEFSEVLP